MKDCLAEPGYINSTETNAGSWPAAARRNWCNGGFRKAIPSLWRKMFKQFNTVTGTYNGSGAGGNNVTSQDYFALPAAKEVLGWNSNSVGNELNALTQFTYYSNSKSNRCKIVGKYYSTWYQRSPVYSWSGDFCIVDSQGDQAYSYTGNPPTYGISPFGCL